jgi:hypothetical protein
MAEKSLFEAFPLNSDIDSEDNCDCRADDYRKGLKKRIDGIHTRHDQRDAPKNDKNKTNLGNYHRPLFHS